MEEISNHHFTEIIKGLMWVYGDSEHPLDKCASFLCEIVREQLLTLIKRAWETSKCRGLFFVHLKINY
jgi:hypothetical protein